MAPSPSNHIRRCTALPGGLVEIATPEVRSPDELLACQRSIDALAADAAADSETSFDLRVLKNSSDALGHVYGCHENYEAEVASGIWLILYRCFIALLWCMQILCLIASLPLMGIIFLVVTVCKVFKGVTSKSSEPQDMFEVVPNWLSMVLITALRLIHFPTVHCASFRGTAHCVPSTSSLPNRAFWFRALPCAAVGI